MPEKSKRISRNSNVIPSGAGVNCTLDIDISATFYCDRCNRPFCDNCLGRKEGAKFFCLECADLRELQDKKPTEKIFIKYGGFVRRALIAAASIAICYNLYIIYSNKPIAQEAVKPPPMSEQTSQLVTCRHQLEVLSALSMKYQDMAGVHPTNFSDIATMTDQPVKNQCPITQQEYIIEFKQDNEVVVSCPDPGAHGLKALFATPGKPAQMKY